MTVITGAESPCARDYVGERREGGRDGALVRMRPPLNRCRRRVGRHPPAVSAAAMRGRVFTPM